MSHDTLFEFPTQFPIKVMGVKQDGFDDLILELIQEYAPDLKIEDITLRESAQGNYIGATVSVNATSREQLDQIYMILTSHSSIKFVL